MASALLCSTVGLSGCLYYHSVFQSVHLEHHATRWISYGRLVCLTALNRGSNDSVEGDQASERMTAIVTASEHNRTFRMPFERISVRFPRISACSTNLAAIRCRRVFPRQIQTSELDECPLLHARMALALTA